MECLVPGQAVGAIDQIIRLVSQVSFCLGNMNMINWPSEYSGSQFFSENEFKI